MPRKRSITLKLILLSVITAACAACVVAVAAYSLGRSMLRSEINERLQASAPDRERRLLAWFEGERDHVALVASNTTLRQLLRMRLEQPEKDFVGPARKILDDADEAIYGFIDLWLTDPAGNIIAATSLVHAGRDSVLNTRFQTNHQRVYVGMPYEQEGAPMVAMAAPIYDEARGQILAVLRVTTDATSLYAILRDRAGLGATGEVLVATRSGNDLRLLGPRADGVTRVAAAQAPILARAVKGESGFEIDSSQGDDEVLAFYRPLPLDVGDGAWGLVAQISSDEAYAPLGILRTWIIINTIVMLVLGGVASVWVARRFTKPLIDLAEAAKAVAAGDLTREVAIDSDDELEQLSVAFNHMTRQLRAAVEHLEGEVEARTADLGRSEFRLAMAMEASDAGVFHYRIPLDDQTYYSDRWAQILGYQREELPRYQEMSAWVKGLFHPDDVSSFTSGYRAFVSGLTESHHGEARMKHRDGHWIVVASRYKAIERDMAGRATQVIGVMIDISKRKALEEELWQAQKLEAVGQLASGVAHEINNLLMGINGCARIILNKLDKEHWAQPYLEQIHAAVDTGGQVTRQLLAFSRKQNTACTVFDMNSCLARNRKLLKSTVGSHVVFSVSLNRDESLVKSDERLLVLVLLNLSLNARDATPEGGRISIGVSNVIISEEEALKRTGLVPGEYVMIRVVDSGCGMDEETRRRAFEPFFTTKPVGKGTGLGLSTAYAIVNQMRGHIDLNSEQGRGTTCRILLPREPAAVRDKTTGSAEVVFPADPDEVQLTGNRSMN